MDSLAWDHLNSFSLALGLDPLLKLHNFRRAGDTWAFQHGVNKKDIMVHGTWKYDAVWTYIQLIPSATC